MRVLRVLKISGPQPFLPEPDRLTLSGALRGHENFEAAQDDCFRLLCFMRMAPKGCDADVVPSPWTTRRLIMEKPMKWHNLICHQISQADKLNEKPAQRRSRLSAWIESQEKARATEYIWWTFMGIIWSNGLVMLPFPRMLREALVFQF